ncbi:MAG: heme-binding protein, partial [Verrucomicrobia bacterium]|nr:heme-binding protein [Verrucomicrobiota bacterium]
ILAQAITRARYFVTNGTATNAVVAVVDREGFVLGVWSFAGASALDVLDAITKAGTAAFLSSSQEAFTSRTAGFIVQQNFPPGILNTGPGPLVGVNFANMSFSDVNRFKNPNSGRNLLSTESGTNGAPISPLAFNALSGLAGSPGGVPLYQNGTNLIGGVAAVLTGQAADSRTRRHSGESNFRCGRRRGACRAEEF